MLIFSPVAVVWIKVGIKKIVERGCIVSKKVMEFDVWFRLLCQDGLHSTIGFKKFQSGHILCDMFFQILFLWIFNIFCQEVEMLHLECPAPKEYFWGLFLNKLCHPQGEKSTQRCFSCGFCCACFEFRDICFFVVFVFFPLLIFGFWWKKCFQLGKFAFLSKFAFTNFCQFLLIFWTFGHQIAIFKWKFPQNCKMMCSEIG